MPAPPVVRGFAALMTTESQPITVRGAAEADLPAMTAAKLDAGTAAWPHIFPAEVLSQLGFPERWTAAVLDRGQRTHALVAEWIGGRGLRDRAAVGRRRRVTRDGGAGRLRHRAEPPGARSRPGAHGAALEALREDGFTTATLWTATDNHRPRRIYERAGWRLDGPTRGRNLGGIASRSCATAPGCSPPIGLQAFRAAFTFPHVPPQPWR